MRLAYPVAGEIFATLMLGEHLSVVDAGIAGAYRGKNLGRDPHELGWVSETGEPSSASLVCPHTGTRYKRLPEGPLVVSARSTALTGPSCDPRVRNRRCQT